MLSIPTYVDAQMKSPALSSQITSWSFTWNIFKCNTWDQAFCVLKLKENVPRSGFKVKYDSTIILCTDSELN